MMERPQWAEMRQDGCMNMWWQGNRRGRPLVGAVEAAQNDVYAGECAHGNEAQACGRTGLCAIEEVEHLEELWADSDDGEGWLMKLVILVWVGFGVVMFINLILAIDAGEARNALMSGLLFAFMATGAWGYGKVR